MSKSNYPNKLDTSIEIPAVRDNITEIGSDVLNSLRAAIFNIEKTLGINPHGSSGNTVSTRLSRSLDESGNITKEALDRSNLLTGPITNIDVSKTAGINESKLILNYPTQLLQDQISILDNKIKLFIQTLEELNVILSSHIHADATNRHYAKAITVESAASEDSSLSTTSLGQGTLQEILQDIYNSHMNYSGEGISETNNSHKALQIYYSNEKTSDAIDATNVQDAIDKVVEIELSAVKNSNLNFNSNGMIRTGSTYDAFEGSSSPAVLVSADTITYSGPDDSSKELISFPNQPTMVATVRPFDVLTILDSPNEEDNIDYIISQVETTSSGSIDYVEVFGGPKNPIEIGTTAQISRSPYVSYNENGLNCSVRPRYLKSNTPDIQVAHPNSATIISSGINTTAIEEGVNDILSLEIDGEGVEIPVFNVDLEYQTIDSIVYQINNYIVENSLNIFAYKIRSLRCFELAISHVMPNISDDIKNRTIKVTSNANDASQALGLSYLLDREIEGSTGNSFHINGMVMDSPGDIKKYTTNMLSLNLGTTGISAKTPVDFLNDGIRSGDLCLIEGSSGGDDGTYRINSVTSEIITLDSTGSTFSGELSEDASVYIIRCTAPIGELEFEVLDGLILIDVFLDENKEIHYHRRANMVGNLISGDFYGVISDISSGFIKDGDNYTLTINTSGMASLTEEPGGLPGPSVFIGATGSYRITSLDGMQFITLEVVTAGAPTSNITCEIEGFAELPSSVLQLCRANYSAKLGFVLGTSSSLYGIPSVLDKKTTGTVDDTIVSEALLERYIQGPRNELRSSGFIRGVGVKSVEDNADGTCTISVYPGIAVINGVRFEYLGNEDVVYKYGEDATDLNNFYIGLNGYGCLIIDSEVTASGEVSPFVDQDVAHIAFVSPTGIEEELDPVDLRLFVDNLDYKVIGDITVANDGSFGHFTSLEAAVDYARMFSKIFPNMGAPSIFVKEGVHEIDSFISLDFDVRLHGSGPQAVIKRSESYELTNSTLDDETINDTMILVSRNSLAEDITYGVTIENLTIQARSGQPIGQFGTMIMVRNNIDNGNSQSALFTFNNIRFIAAPDYVVNDSLTTGGPQEMPFHIGYGNDEHRYQNIIISNCLFRGLGYHEGVIYLHPDNHYRNISVSNCISTESIDTTLGYTLIKDGGSTSTTNVIEVNNMILDVSTP